VLSDVREAVCVITGGASGIGRALGERFAADGAAAVVLIDRDRAAVERTADEIGKPAQGVAIDVTDADALTAAIQAVQDRHGRIDFFAANAGIAVGQGLATDAEWNLSWQVHVMAHVYAARAVLPGMLARGHGHFLVTASAAGLLTEMDSATYAVTKHGSVALAEWLAINYGGQGVGFSCLCPQAVRTPMVANLHSNSATLAAGAVIEPTAVVDAVMDALAHNRFLILPHPEVAAYEQRRAGDRDRWLGGMRKVKRSLRDHKDS
jgi:NAD(P)-dependent dehydrogenase (short-subunit alcohol dehydrogenase family)